IPLVDVYEDGDMLVVEAPLPGMDPNKIELSIDHGALIIKAGSERKTEVDEKNYYRKEVRHGVMFRKIPLPAAVQEDAAQASYDDGVLKVRLPKREQNEKTIKLHIKKS
ncbi:Hsp20/alpha crystallin family protein, partial [Patescibacteria group bacterium]|nr:Hsp20/alpha crystallin family protein [Patescibacteria group bacterium]